MKNIIKILIGISILLITISIVSAVSIDDWTLPDDFKKESDSWASNGGFGISVSEYNDADYDLFFTNTTDYTVMTADNITNYTDKTSNQVGCDEIIEDNGSKYLVECYNTNPNGLEKCYQYLKEFNEMNNVEPIEV